MTSIRETIARAILYEAMPAVGAWDIVGPDGRQSCLDQADAVLRALDEAGLVVVRKEPSEAMQKAGAAKVLIDWHCAWTVEKCLTSFAADCLPDIYRAMIAASVVE